MRHLIASATLLAALAGTAGATDVPGSKDRAPTDPGSAGAAASSGVNAGPGPSVVGLGTTDQQTTYGLLELNKNGKREGKFWEVGATWDTHVMFIQQDLEGQGANKVLNQMYFFGRVDLTKNNRLSVRGGFTNRHIADDQETGYRMTDISLTYTRTIPLPKEFRITASGSLTAPSSFYSQKASLITAPSISLGLAKRLGHLSADVRGFGTYYIVKCSTSGIGNYDCNTPGGSPNAKVSLGAFADVEYSMPFHEALTIGLDGYTGYTWVYDVQNSATYPDGSQIPQSVPTPYVGQVYGGEVYVRYAFPNFYGIKSDLTLAVANGDPALGYNSVLHDGIAHVYGYFRLYGEFYASLSARF